MNVATASFSHWFVRFIAARLTRGTYLGLHLTVGAVLTLAAGWAFGVIAEDVVTNDRLVEIDAAITAWFNARATPTVVAVAKAVTFLGSGLFITIATGVVGLALWRRQRWHRLAALVLSVGGGSAFNVLLKHYFERPRPEVENPIVHLTTYSFPSGHTISATLFFGVCALYIAQRTPLWSQRIWAAAAGLIVIALVAASRVCLGAHFLSDVLAAMCVGLMWLAACVTGVEVVRRYWHQRTAPAAP